MNCKGAVVRPSVSVVVMGKDIGMILSSSSKLSG